MGVAPGIVSDELWKLVEPLLPRKEGRFRYPGRKRPPDRRALQRILSVLHTGIPRCRPDLRISKSGGRRRKRSESRTASTRHKVAAFSEGGSA